MANHKPNLHPTIRERLEELTLTQKREGVYLLSQLNAEVFDAEPLTNAKMLIMRLQERFAENIGQLSHGLSGNYGDGEIDSPLRGAVSEVSGAAATMGAHSTSHPATTTLRRASAELAGILADYSILHTLSLAASNDILAKMCLTHLDLTKSLGEELVIALPAVANLEFATDDDKLSGMVAAPAREHIKKTIQ
ncbi:MAG: hypothetical protein ACI8T1_004418 [Verrucomicrobiales bacterium]|jgi:hypothetical protein